MKTPKVSVVIPTYNGISRGYLDDAIQSVFAQTFEDFELIIVDDGSQDGTHAELVKRYGHDSRVTIITQLNKGLPGARNTGIRASRGVYVALLDDDDVWLPEKVAFQVEGMDAAGPAVAMVYCAAQYIDADGTPEGIRYTGAADDMFRAILLQGNIVTCPSSVMIRRSAMDVAGMFDEDMRSAEDLELWLRLARQFKIVSTANVLLKYRVHSNSLTFGSCQREEFYEYCLFYRLAQEGVGIPEECLWRKLYERTAVRRFFMNDWRGARRFCRIAAAYGPIAVRTRAIFWLAAVPWLACLLKKGRRSYKEFLMVKRCPA